MNFIDRIIQRLKLVLPAALVALPCLSLHSQDRVPLFKATCGPKANWTVTFQLKSEVSAPHPVSRETWKVPAKRRELTMWSDNNNTEIWRYDGMLMEKSRNYKSGAIQIYRTQSAGEETPDFPELDWAKDKPMDKTSTFAGKKAWIITLDQTAEAKLSDQTGGKSRTSPTLWVSCETGLPLAFDDGYQLWQYRFSPPPNELALPEPFKKEVEKIAFIEEKSRMRQVMSPN